MSNKTCAVSNDFGISTLVIAVFRNAISPISFSDFGILISESTVQSANAPVAIEIIVSASSTLFKFTHLRKAYRSIVVTVFGTEIVSNPVQPANKNCAICVVPFSKVTIFNFSQFSNGPSEQSLPLSNETCAVSNDFGISIAVNAISENAALPKSTKFSDSTTLDRFVHSANADS